MDRNEEKMPVEVLLIFIAFTLVALILAFHLKVYWLLAVAGILIAGLVIRLIMDIRITRESEAAKNEDE